MALALKSLTITFDTTAGIKQRESATAVFGGTVKSAQAALKGFNCTYPTQERKFHSQEIDLDITSITGNTVTVAADFLIRDKSGNIDDPFKGWVEAVIIADVG